MSQPVAMASTACMTVALAGALVLLAACVGHARDFDRLRATLVLQRLVPYRLHRAVAVGVVSAEIGIGGAGTVSVLTRHARPVLYCEAILYVAFLGYLAALKGLRPGVPCGCFHGDGPVRVLALGRAAVFAAGATAAAVLPWTPATNIPALVVFPSAALLAVVLRVLPALAGGPVVSWRN
ncbi:MauE/DoxX family redox-associated membrane protein [Actinopolymorpha pittospori]